MANSRGRSQIPVYHSPLSAELRIKLTRLFSRHEEEKIEFHWLNSQIKDGLAVVGLTNVEMAEEGPFTAIIIDKNDPCGNVMNQEVSESLMESSVASGRHHSNHITGLRLQKYSWRV